MDKIKRARSLRRESTDAERRLWRVLQNRGLGGVKFRRQLPIGRYIADFASVEAKLIVELDGGQHHDQADYDARRSGDLEIAGWRVVRFWNTDVMENLDGVADAILAELALARGESTPSP